MRPTIRRVKGNIYSFGSRFECMKRENKAIEERKLDVKKKELKRRKY